MSQTRTVGLLDSDVFISMRPEMEKLSRFFTQQIWNHCSANAIKFVPSKTANKIYRSFRFGGCTEGQIG
jgi:hypothetical protein